jgi:hypothetical protein
MFWKKQGVRTRGVAKQLIEESEAERRIVETRSTERQPSLSATTSHPSSTIHPPTMFASRSSHFHDKENAHGSMSFAHRTPARGLGGGKDANLLGFKTGLRHPGGAGAGGGADKLTMTTRTGKGGEKKGGKGSGEDEGIGGLLSQPSCERASEPEPLLSGQVEVTLARCFR